jgi:hypothetical protein
MPFAVPIVLVYEKIGALPLFAVGGSPGLPSGTPALSA